MNRENYINYRKNNNLPIDLLWEYYNNETTPENRLIHNIHSFNQAFQMYQHMFGLDLSKMFSYYDKKFNVNILNNKKGEIIKIY